MWVQFLGREDPLEEEMAIHSPLDRGAWRATVHRVAKNMTEWESTHILLATGKRATDKHGTWVRPQRLSSGTFAGTFKKWVDCFHSGCGVDRLPVQSSMWLSLSEAHRKSLPESKGNTEESRAGRRENQIFGNVIFWKPEPATSEVFSCESWEDPFSPHLRQFELDFIHKKDGRRWHLSETCKFG